jgi:hypothetical protein
LRSFTLDLRLSRPDCVPVEQFRGTVLPFLFSARKHAPRTELTPGFRTLALPTARDRSGNPASRPAAGVRGALDRGSRNFDGALDGPARNCSGEPDREAGSGDGKGNEWKRITAGGRREKG